MRSDISFKIVFLVALLFMVIISARGQAILPFTYDGGNPGITITGLTQSGLGQDYPTSPKMYFNSQGDYLILNFLGTPGILSFKIRWSQTISATRFPGDFTLLQSNDGITYTTVQLYNSLNGTALTNVTAVNEVFTTLLSTSRYLKWVYTTKSNGYIALGAISLTQGYTSFLNVSANALSGFTYVATNGPSAEYSFVVGGSSLTDNIVITAPADYEISNTTGTAFVATNSITLTQSGGAVSATTIYSRLKKGLAAGNYNENITVSSVNANTGIIACNGTVVPNPTITLTDITDPTLSTVRGIPVSQTLNISGVNLNVDMGLSITGADASLFSLSQYGLAETGGCVPNTFVTITYTPNAVGSNIAYLTTSSLGAMPVIRTLNGISSVVTDLNPSKLSLLISAENGKILFNASAGETVDIFNSTGQTLVRKQAADGLNTIPVASHGFLLVKVGSRIAKVIL